MKFGLSTLLFGGYDRDIALTETKTAGYDGIELTSIPGMGAHFHPGMPDWIYDGIRSTIERSGLVLESCGCSGSLGTDRFEGLAEAAGKLGAPYMTAGTGGEMENEESWNETMGIIRDCIPVLRANDVRLSIKPHVRAAVYNIESAKRFMNELDTEWVGLNIDNTHLVRHGDDPIEAVRELSDWIFTARIRDFKSEDLGIGPVENQIPGKGQTDVEAYYKALVRYTDLDIITVEMVGAKDFELDEVLRTINETLEALKSYE